VYNLDDQICIPNVWFTQAGYGPVSVIARWERGYDHPLYLVTNMELPDEAVYCYKKRFQIETFFSDQKSRGFFLHKSHLADPRRLSNLMIAACLAYLWIVYMGCLSDYGGWIKLIHRPDRCDWSLFRGGLALLDHFLNECIPIPVSFNLLEKIMSGNQRFTRKSRARYSNYPLFIQVVFTCAAYLLERVMVVLRDVEPYKLRDV
jgi:hypothetical protein